MIDLRNIRARVTLVTFLGHGYRLTLDTPVGEIEADSSSIKSGTVGRVKLLGPLWALPESR